MMHLKLFARRHCEKIRNEPKVQVSDIRATVEYADGKKSSPLTDGLTVQVRDGEGERRYMRKWRAVNAQARRLPTDINAHTFYAGRVVRGSPNLPYGLTS